MGLEPKRRTKELKVNEAVTKTDSKTIHHTFFVYPPRPKPNPAFALFFNKLNSVKEELNTHPLVPSLSNREECCVKDDLPQTPKEALASVRDASDDNKI